MERSSTSTHRSELGGNPLQCNRRREPSERSLATSLRTIVRRVLRTNVGRTHFELRILGEARRLLEIHRSKIGKDTLVSLIVDSLLQNRRGIPTANTGQEGWVVTQAQIPDSTFAF